MAGEAVYYVGDGPSGRPMSNSGKLTVVFQNFASMKEEGGVAVSSPVMKCHGYRWKVDLYPKGDDTSNERDEQVSLFLHCVSASNDNATVVTKFSFLISSANYSLHTDTIIFKKHVETSWGWTDFALRSNVLDSASNFLVNGNLTLEINIQVALEKPPSWAPSSSLSTDMLKMLESAETNSDVVFEIDQGKERELFYAHSCVLNVRAPLLAALVEDYEKNTYIPVGNTTPEIFRPLLRFVYGGELPPEDILLENAQMFIKVADRFGCTCLKLAAEAKLVNSGITTKNAADLILLADATNCAMLKEAAMEHFVANTVDVMKSEGFKKVEESARILTELISALALGTKAYSSCPDKEYKQMRVATLRQKLRKKGFGIDGSKEMLILRLKDADAAENQAISARGEGEGDDNDSNEGD